MTGHVGDALFAGSVDYFPRLLKELKFALFCKALVRHWQSTGSVSGTGLIAAVKRPRPNRSSTQRSLALPTWLDPEFARRSGAAKRWSAKWRMWSELNDLRGQLARPWFSILFEDHEALKLPLVVRHPFSDRRLVEFMLRVPNHMHQGKRILREAMRHRLPDEVLVRPKQGLPGNLIETMMKRGLRRNLPKLDFLAEYIDIEKYLAAYASYVEGKPSEATWSAWMLNRPIALAYWLNNTRGELPENT